MLKRKMPKIRVSDKRVENFCGDNFGVVRPRPYFCYICDVREDFFAAMRYNIIKNVVSL